MKLNKVILEYIVKEELDKLNESNDQFMHILKIHLKITDLAIFVIVFIFFSTLQARSLDKYNKAGNIAGYFTGIVLLNENKYI